MSNILKTNVDQKNLTKLIQRLGRDCTPEQFMREYAKNCIEAIQRTNETGGKMIVDVNRTLQELTGDDSMYKICFIDNGDGMTCEEMRTHLNNLSSSGDSKNEFENYGMGAKIAALTRNHAGILYESWKDGEGHQILIKYDEDEMAYGIQPVAIDGSNVEWCTPLDDEVKPDIIDQHGTRVTLFGMSEEQDTMLPPPGVLGGRENWIFQYLNTRFFEFPSDVQVMARVGYYRDWENKKHNYLRQVGGQKSSLDKWAEHSGSVSLSDAMVHWWILKAGRQGHGREFLSGHTGCLNQRELFDITYGRANRASHFGIIFGKEDVVLYVEPSPTDYVQDTTRTRLAKADGSALPWSKWADEFREKMPTEISTYMKKMMSGSTNQSHTDSIKKRLRDIQQFYKLSRYRATPSGDITADPESETKGKTGGGTTNTKKKTGIHRQRDGKGLGTIEALLLASRKDTGLQAEEVSPDNFPVVRWISVADNNRSPDELEDRAAEYLEKDNLIRANADFQGFTDIIEHFAQLYGAEEEAEQVIKNEVQEAFEQQLVEVVTGALSLKNRPRWNPEQFDQATSEEALTVAVMCRYHLINFIQRRIGSQLGKPPTPQS